MAHTDILTHNGIVIRRLHSPDGRKQFGLLALPVNYDGRNPELVKEYPDLIAARLVIGAYDRKTVDKVNGVEIFKLIIDGMQFGYAFIQDAKITRCGSLAQCRKELGWTPVVPAKLTPPKSSHPQNQKGYKAPTR